MGATMASVPTPEQPLQLQSSLKIEDCASQLVIQESNRTYLGTYKRWIWGSVIALCCLAPAVAFLGAHSEPASGHGKVRSGRELDRDRYHLRIGEQVLQRCGLL